MTSIRKPAVKWLVAVLIAASCSAPAPAVIPSPTPVTHRLQVVAAGADGPVAGLRVCASTLSGAQSCAPTGADGTATFTLPADTYQVRSEVPASQRQLDDQGAPVNTLGGAPVGADLTQGNCSRAVAMGILHTTSGRCTLTCCLSGQLLTWGLATSALTSSLLGASHDCLQKKQT